MINLRICFVLVGCASALVGCNVQSMGNQHSDMRSELLKMQEEQVLDNLIRAKQDQGLLQISYGSIVGTMSNEVKATVSGAREEVDNNLAPGAAGVLLARFVRWTTGVGGEAKQFGQMAVTGHPVNTKFLFARYKEFADNDEFFKSSAALPEEGYHVGRWREDVNGKKNAKILWYVPNTAAAKSAYFALFRDVASEVPPKQSLFSELLNTSELDRLNNLRTE